MTKDEIIRMAREAGFDSDYFDNVECSCDECNFLKKPLERFAALVAEPLIETNKALAKEIIELRKQAEQKPIGYVIEDNDYEGSKIWAEPINGCCLPVYLAPIRAKDLTDDEVEDVCCRLWSGGWRKKAMNDFARAVIAKFKEKNK